MVPAHEPPPSAALPLIARAKTHARPKPAERRGAVRQTINRRAQYIAALGALPRDLLVIDLSDSGARLYAEAGLPDEFTLGVSGGGKPVQHDCRVVWRLGGETGVAFTRTRG